MRKRIFLASALAVVVPSQALWAADAPQPVIGFAVSVDTEGFFLNPTITRIVVSEVLAGGQAAAAGLAVGDEIVKVEAIVVKGSKADDLKPHMEFKPGVPKRLTLRRVNGTEYQATLTKPGKAAS